MRKQNSQLIAFLGVFALVSVSYTGWAATTIETFSLWNGSSAVSSWGGGSTPTYGQTFTAPSDNYLESFSFSIRNNSGSSISYQPFVYAWNGSTITGPALFTGSTATLTSSTDFQIAPVNTNSTPLVVGQQYVAFFTTTTTAPTAGFASWGFFNSTNPYSGGAFVFSGSSTFAGLSQNGFGVFGDLAFSMTFSNVPEPTSAMLAGMGAIAIFLRRRRASVALLQ